MLDTEQQVNYYKTKSIIDCYAETSVISLKDEYMHHLDIGGRF